METPLIVLVEDDESIRDALADVLACEGYKVCAFANGREAVNGLKNVGTPCLILLDWMMPVMNGEEFINARASIDDVILSVPIVVVSAVAHLARGLPGVADYMKKPVDIESLLHVIERYAPRPVTTEALVS